MSTQGCDLSRQDPLPSDSVPPTVPTTDGAGFVQIDLNEVAIALSEALDLVGLEDVRHGKRVAFMATEIGRATGLDDDDLHTLFISALLHDSGVSSSRVFKHLTQEFDWEGSAEHCIAGYEFLRDFAPFGRVAEIVLHHHDRWDRPPSGAAEPGTALLANAIFLADRTDALAGQSGEDDILMARDPLRAAIERRSGTYFAPDLVKAFVAASESEAFWLTLESHHLERYVAEARHAARPQTGDFRMLLQLATVFGRIVDAKSPFTARHSLGVAQLARLLGRLAGLSADVCDQLEIAGLLHDIGKLRVPDELLEKEGPLDDRERSTMSRHSFETYQILRRVRPFETLAVWAGFHHETLSGRGYPFHCHGREIPVPARIVAVADVFQALAQRRPYRLPLAPQPILSELYAMAGAERLDTEVVDIVGRNLEACWMAALGEATGSSR